MVLNALKLEHLERPVSSDVLNGTPWNMARDSTGRLNALNVLSGRSLNTVTSDVKKNIEA